VGKGMRKYELLKAVKDGKLTGEAVDDFVDEEWCKENPESALLYSMSEDLESLRLDGEPFEVIERAIPKRDYYDENLHGQPMKLVFKIGGTVFVAIGEYDSWEGEHFSNGFSEAELVDVPTWLPKR